jgi:hypothetical protein
MHLEDSPASRVRIEQVREASLDARREVDERQRPHRRLERRGQPTRVPVRLHLDAAKRVPFRLGFEHAHRMAVHEQQVVRVT